MTLPDLIALAAWLIGGIAMGAVYLALIARSVAAIEAAATWRAAVGWLVLRLALAAAVLALAAMQGAAPLLAVLAGFLVARSVAIRRVTMG